MKRMWSRAVAVAALGGPALAQTTCHYDRDAWIQAVGAPTLSVVHGMPVR